MAERISTDLFRAFQIVALYLLLGLGLTGKAQAARVGEWRWDDVDRIVVVADVHGAQPALIQLLQKTSLIDASLNWVGGDDHLVSLGDLLDRGPASRQTMDLLMKLQAQSAAVGGGVHVVAGNHELMNLIGDLRYVSKAEYQAFAADETADMREQGLRAAGASEPNQSFLPGYFAHRAAFSQTGTYGSWLLSLPAVVVLNDIAFVHGGLPEMVGRSDLEGLNDRYQNAVSSYLTLRSDLVSTGLLSMDETRDMLDAAKLASQAEGLKSGQKRKIVKFIDAANSPILADEGPLWARSANYCRAIYERPILTKSLASIKAKKVVVGHTPTPDSRVHTMHEGQLTRLDTGMLKSHYKGRPAAMVIEAGREHVQYLDPEHSLPITDDLPGAYGLTKAQTLEALKQGVLESETGGSTGGPSAEQPFRVQIRYNEKTLQGIFYPHSTSGREGLELSAYALDQMLGFDLVPMTIARTFGSDNGALQLVYLDELSEGERLDNQTQISGWCPLDRQFQLTYAWDILTANSGRNATNLGYQQRRGLIYLRDHAQAFGSNKRLPKSLRSNSVTLTPEIRNALRALTEKSLQEKLGSWLDEKSIEALLSRRDKMLKLFKSN